MSRWFRALFIAVMFAACAVLIFCTLERVDLDFQLADTRLMLETSRGREIKQQHEYDTVAAELPETQAALAAATPLADAAKALEGELRAARKQLRADQKTLTAAVEAVQTDVDAAQAAYAQLKADVRTQIDNLTGLIAQGEQLLSAQDDAK